MDSIILTLHPITDSAKDVLKDPRNANLLVKVDVTSNDDIASQGEASALSLTLDRAPKTGANFVLGRHQDADIVLTDPAISARHCLISVDEKGVPVLQENSTNGTLINGKRYRKQAFEIKNGMQIDIRDAAFGIQVPWRGDYQDNYEYKARRAKESRAKTPLQALPSQSAPIYTTLEEVLGSYTLTNTLINSSKLASNEVSRTEIVRKGRSFFAAKRFHRQALGKRELRAWEKIIDHKINHANIIHLEEIVHCQSGPVLIMELLPIGDLGQMFYEQGNHASHDVAVSVMRQLLSALVSLHGLGIVHTAIQLDNILIASEQPIHIKLTGFEFSNCGEVPISSMKAMCPAPEVWEKLYRDCVAPLFWEELLKDRGYFEERPRPWCGSPVDIWSAGVVCSQLTLGKAPCYRGKSRDEEAVTYVDLLVAARSESSTGKFEVVAEMLGLPSRSIPQVLLSFLQKLLDPESESRARAEDCLVHSWLTQHAQGLPDNAREPQVESFGHKRRKLNSGSTE